jgi:hypothetical protein
MPMSTKNETTVDMVRKSKENKQEEVLGIIGTHSGQ